MSAKARLAELQTGSARQHAALPFEVRNGETRVMLVTSRETGRWVLPKGWHERKLTGPELAAKEAFEEAGLKGEISAEPVGSYSYTKRLPGGRTVQCDVDLYPMRVTRLLNNWPEKRQRKRRWFTLAQAALEVEEGDLAMLLLRLAAAEIG